MGYVETWRFKILYKTVSLLYIISSVRHIPSFRRWFWGTWTGWGVGGGAFTYPIIKSIISNRLVSPDLFDQNFCLLLFITCVFPLTIEPLSNSILWFYVQRYNEGLRATRFSTFHRHCACISACWNAGTNSHPENTHLCFSLRWSTTYKLEPPISWEVFPEHNTGHWRQESIELYYGISRNVMIFLWPNYTNLGCK